MNDLHGLQTSFDHILWLSLALVRGATAFLLLPLLSPQMVPAMVRNSIMVGFGVIVLFMQPEAQVIGAGTIDWLRICCREIFVGLLIGFFFGGIIFAFEIAGQYIDQKVGGNQADTTDPFTGQKTSVYSSFLARLANFVFVSCGGLLYLTNTLLKSYIVWPINGQARPIQIGDTTIFENAFQGVMALSLGIATPALLILTLVEASAGLLNRFSPQLNVFSSSLSVKNWIAAWIVFLTCGMFGQTLSNEVFARMGIVLNILAQFRG